MNPVQLAAVVFLLGVWVVLLLVRDRFVLPIVARGSIKFTHVLPAVLQIVLFTYWAAYWRPVVEHLPVLMAQLVCAYLIDFLLGWTMQRSYRPTLGPVPIVLSANLFVWFRDDLFSYLLVIAIALGSKLLLVVRGRHVFNPSVLGLAAFGIFSFLAPQWFSYQDISHDFDRPPYMAHLIVLLALVPQIRLGTAPVALGAAFAMLATMFAVSFSFGYHGGPSPWWPPWLLAITLLAGDPATIPASTLSRLLFGLTLGFLFYVVSRAMLIYSGSDFFAKIIPIPIVNALVPWLEDAGAGLVSRWPQLRSESTKYLLGAAWVSASIVMLILNGRT